MPVSYIPSAEQLINRQKTTAKKRRRNQNAEIDELAQLLPVKLLPVVSQSIGGVLDFDGLGTSDKTLPIDKISVLRIVSAFLKFQEFVKDGHLPLSGDKKKRCGSGVDMFGDLMAEALDGFLIVLDKNGTILFVTDAITAHLGLTQNDVIGLSLKDITHPDDMNIIEENLVAKNALPSGIINKGEDTQPRQFYLRMKSTMSPGRVQLSRFMAYTKVQVTGSLKVGSCKDLTSGTESVDKDSKFGMETSGLEVMGFVGECRLIECTFSILEITVPQPHFTTTISLNMKIVAVESQVLDITGFSVDTFIGSRMRDYFHPADYLKLIPCEVMLMHTGHAVSPIFRFMSSNGGWIWLQMEGMLRYKPGTKEKQYWEVKSKIVSQEEGSLALIEQNELYTMNPDPNQDFLNLHKDLNFLSRLSDLNHLCKDGDVKKMIVHSLTEANMSESVRNAYLDGREQGLCQLPGEIKTVLHHNQANAFRAEKLREMAENNTEVKVPESRLTDNSIPPVESTTSDISSHGTSFPVLTNISTHSSSASGTSAVVLQHYQATPIAPITMQNATSTVLSMPSAHDPTSNTSLTGQTIPVSQTTPNSYAMRSAIPTAHVQPIPRVAPISQVTPNFDDKSSMDKCFIETSVFNSSGFTPTNTLSFQGHTFNPSVGVDSSYTQMPGCNQGGAYSNAGTDTFGKISTECFPNFSGNGFQNNQIPLLNQSEICGNYPMLEAFPSTNPTLDLNSIPSFCDQNLNGGQNGDQILEDLLREVNEVGPGGMGGTSSCDHTHQYMCEEVTMSATCQVTGGHVNMCHGDVANEVSSVNGGNSEVLEILSQFS